MYKNSKTSLFAFPVKANQCGGARHIFAYKQASWKGDVEDTIDKDSSQVVAGGKESFTERKERKEGEFYWK